MTGENAELAPTRDPSSEVILDYVNWSGDRRSRPVRPYALEFRTSPWRAADGRTWILVARDLEDGLVKDFAMSGVKGWRGPA